MIAARHALLQIIEHFRFLSVCGASQARPVSSRLEQADHAMEIVHCNIIDCIAAMRSMHVFGHDLVIFCPMTRLREAWSSREPGSARPGAALGNKMAGQPFSRRPSSYSPALDQML
ncbi:hypothetical protein DAR30_24700 [Salmonella enterica subsp. enterica serovar Enteritidis]|nr:hypothetical protein [Salmonella enterica subsp. enterica serovar Enteritidis]